VIEHGQETGVDDIRDVNWSEDDSIAAFIDHCLDLKAEHNLDAERQAQFNSSWYLGQQLKFWNKDRKRMETQANPNGRVRVTVNLIGGLCDAYIAKLGTAQITLEAVPQTDDLMDYERSRLMTDIFRYYDRYLSLPGTVQFGDLAALLHGECYIKVAWEPMAGRDIGPIGAADLGMDETEFTKKYGETPVKVKEGDLYVGVVPVFNVFWGPPGVPFNQAEWVVEVNERSSGYVIERYGLDPEEITYDSDSDVQIIRPNEQYVWGERERGEGIVLVKTLWVAQNKKLKGLENGRNCIVVSKKVVKNGPIPYQHRRIPIVQWRHSVAPGDPRGYTPVTDLLPVQADLNKAVSQFCENRELMANPVWMVPEHAIVNEKEWVAAAGGMRRYRGAQMPLIQQGAAMPIVVYSMLDQSRKWMQDIIGLRDISQGKNPAGVRAAKTVSLLKESDEERMAAVNRRRIDAWQQVGWLMLMTLRQYAREPRLIRILGDERAVLSRTYMGKDFGTSISPYDIKVSTTGDPRSRSARIDDMDRMMERGFLNPNVPEDKKYVLSVLGDDWRQPLDKKKEARELQHMRNFNMAHGKYLSPALFEDQEEMMEVMSQFRQKSFFRNLPLEVQALFNKYEEECISLMALRKPRWEQIALRALDTAGIQPQQPQPATQMGPPTTAGAGAPQEVPSQ
jgi:hypothetical protein